MQHPELGLRAVSVGISCSQDGAHQAGGWKICLGDFLLSQKALTGRRLEDPSRTWEYKSFKEWRLTGLEAGRSVLGISGEALTGLEARRSVSDLGI